MGEHALRVRREGDTMKRLRLLVASLLATGCTTTTTERLRLPPLETVPRVDLGRYVGTWYEIAAFPQRFQRGCTATTATYTLREDGHIDVVNRCRKDSPDGPEKVAKGRARIVDPATNANQSPVRSVSAAVLRHTSATSCQGNVPSLRSRTTPSST